MRRLLSFVRDLYRNRQGHRTLPRFLTYTVTFACNARCIMCDSWKMEAKGDLSLSEIEGIFTQLPRMDAVRLTGGEPFVRKDLPEIAELVRKKLQPLVLHVTTNGFLPDRIIKFCTERDRSLPLQLMVSIDGVADKHNHIRGHSQAFQLAMQTVQELAPRQKELRLRVLINQTIVDGDSVEQYRLLQDVLRPWNVGHNIVIAYDTSATYNLQRELNVAPVDPSQFTTFGEFTEEQLQQLMTDVEQDIARLPVWERWAKRYYLRGIANRLLRHRGSPNPACVALNSHLRLFPNGDVPTCQFNSQIAGNLRQQSFADLWDSATTRKQREWVRRCAGCWAECEVLPSAIYTGDLLWTRNTPRPTGQSTSLPILEPAAQM